MFPAGRDSPPGVRPAYRTLRIGRGGAPTGSIPQPGCPGKNRAASCAALSVALILKRGPVEPVEARRQPLLHRPNLLPERGFHLAVRRSLRFQVMPQPVILDDRSLGIGGLAVHLARMTARLDLK